MSRSAQDILAERRDNTLELARERDPIAKALLQYHIDRLDDELAAMRGSTYAALETLRRAGAL